MSNAAVSRNQASKQPPFPIKPMFEEGEYPTKRLQHRITAANGHVDARKMDLPFCPDPSDKERLVTVLDDYKDACAVDQLNYQDNDLHRHVIDVLGKDLRNVWNTKLAGIAVADRTNANFVDNVRSFLKTYLPKSAFQVQRQYMIHAKKPFHMDCYTLASRLRAINDLSVYLPGSGGSKLYPTDTEMKNAYYALMLPKWQSAFDAAGHATDDANYTMDVMSSFMEQQRLHSYNSNNTRRGPAGAGRGGSRDRRFHPYRGGRGSSTQRGYRHSYQQQQQQHPQGQQQRGGFVPRNPVGNSFNNNRNPRTHGQQMNGYRGSSGSGNYRNSGTNPSFVRRGRSSGAPPPRQMPANANRDVSNLFFNGQEYAPVASPPNYDCQDNYFNGNPNEDYPEENQHVEDGFYQNEEIGSEEYFPAGAPEDGFFNQDSEVQDGHNQDWPDDAYDTYDY